MIDSYTKVSVADIRKELISFGYAEEEVHDIKSKNTLAGLLDECRHPQEYEKVLENLEEEPVHEVVPIPTPQDIGWDAYLMSLLSEQEIFKGQPTVGGLRRLTLKLIGDIREVRTHIIQTPNKENDNRATAIVGIGVHGDDGVYRYADGAADFYHGNTGAYGQHPVANAETRAEGRAYRKLLKVNKLISAEEMEGFTMAEPSPYVREIISSIDNPIKDTQLIMIKKLCSNDGRGLNINVNKLVDSIKEKENVTIDSLSYDDGQAIMERLSQYQQKMDSIPESLKGYDNNWENL